MRVFAWDLSHGGLFADTLADGHFLRWQTDGGYMPNWCNNTLELKHDDPVMIERAKKAFQDGRLLDEFIPVPYELNQGIDHKDWDKQNHEYQKELQDARESLNKKYFGFKDWYDFCVSNWGTKWDVGADGYINFQDPHNLSLSFDSAYSPPIDAYKKLESMGFEIYALYFESGMMFCGTYGQGTDEFYNIEGNADWVKENIPEYLDHAFCISEQMQEWEEDNA
jgi:hypothetical protein